MKSVSDRIETCSNLESFFGELLRDAMAVEKVELEHQSFVYVTNLFIDFSANGALHGRQKKGEPGTPALVWLYEDAKNAAEPGRRFDAYRHLGDVSLVVSGLFSPHVERSLVGIDYYVQMGASAYDAASTLARTGFARLLAELASKFHKLVDVLTRMAERTTLPVNRDLEALCERLLRAPSGGFARDKLLDRGLVLARVAVEA
jgi:hypothetical protein